VGKVKLKPTTWQETLKAASGESRPAKRRALCETARRLIQERLIAIAGCKNHLREERAMEEALRQVWAIEQKVRNAPKRARRKQRSRGRR